jgi:hypothetical protein
MRPEGFLHVARVGLLALIVATCGSVQRGEASTTPWNAGLELLNSTDPVSGGPMSATLLCIGAALVRAAAARTKSLGFRRLYLYTSGDLPRYYERLGWVIDERVEYLGKERTLMHYDLVA